MNNTFLTDIVGGVAANGHNYLSVVLFIFLFYRQIRFEQYVRGEFRAIHHLLKEMVVQIKELQKDMAGVKDTLRDIHYHLKFHDSKFETHEDRFKRLESQIDESKIKSKQA